MSGLKYPVMADDSIDSCRRWSPKKSECESILNYSRNSFSSDIKISDVQSKDISPYIKPESTISGPEVRFINPAIYAESLNDEDEGTKVKICVKIHKYTLENDPPIIQANSDDSTTTHLLSTLSLKNDQETSQETYRCYSLTSSSSLENSTVRSKSLISRPNVRIERRCKISGKSVVQDDLYCAKANEQAEVRRYSLDGHRVVQISTTSLSASNISELKLNGIELARKLAYDEWIRKKREDAQRKKEEEYLAERKKQVEEEKLTREKEDRERRERDNFLQWTERKKREEAEKKATIEKEVEFQTRLKEIEAKTELAKTLCLRQWARKKEEEQKAEQRKQRLKQKKVDEERKKRLEESSKAYEKWREKSKNRPKPATQGLLPHQKAKPAYVNPTPWQGIISDISDEEAESLLNKRN